MTRKQRNTLSLFTAVILSAVAILYLLRHPTTTRATWFDDSYAFRIALTINNPGVSLTNRKVKYDIDTSTLITNGKMQSDCGDSRFTDVNGKELQYYLDSSGGACNTTSTDYYVLYPTLPAGDSTIFHYYGNPTATNGTQPGQFSATTFSQSSTTPSAEANSPGPIFYYKFSEGTGTTLNDATTANNDLTLSGTGAWRSPESCISDNCLELDGTDYATDTSLDTRMDVGTGDFTISAWFKHSSTVSGTDYLLTRSSVGPGFFGFKIYMKNTGVICFGIDDDTSGFPEDEACSTTTFLDSAWHHVVGVKDDTSSITIYVDGRQEGQDASLLTTGSLNSTAFYLGTDASATPPLNPWIGWIDEVKFFRFGKTLAQIKAEYLSRGTSKGTGENFQPDKGRSLTEGLVGYWKMDETSWTQNCSTANIADSSGNGFHGTSCPSTTGPTTGTGRFGLGGLFDGNNDYVSIPTSFTLPSERGSVSVWVYPTSATAYDIMGAGVSTNDFRLSPGNNLYGFFITKDYRVSYTTDPTLNTWTLVTLTWDQVNGSILYFNGQRVGSNPEPPPAFTQTGLSLGSNPSEAEILTGNEDEVRVYNRPLSSSEIADLYEWGPSPTGHWKFDENTGQIVSDSSGNELSGTLGDSTSLETDDPIWDIGKFGPGLTYSQVNDTVVEIVDNDKLEITAKESFSLSAWVRRTGKASFNNPQIVALKKLSGDNGAGYQFMVESTSTCSLTGSDGNFICLRLSDGTRSFSVISTSTIDVDFAWHHVAVTLDRSTNTARLYIDGVESTTTTSGTISSILDASNTSDLCIGTNCTTGNELNGQIDDLRLYKYARTGKQIIEDMNGGHPSVGSPVSSPIIHWKLDEQNGTTANNSNPQQSSLAPSLTGTVWKLETDCQLGGCLHFDTNNDTASAGDVSFLDGLTAMTVSYWINPDSISSTRRSIIGKNNYIDPSTFDKNFVVVTDATVGDEIEVHIADTVTEANDTNYYTTSGLDIEANIWQHVTIVYDSSQAATSRVKVYKDGHPVSGSVTGTIPSDGLTSGSTSNLTLGSDQGQQFLSTLAKLDDVKIYNYALTQAEVLVDHNANSAVTAGGVLATTHTNEGSSLPTPVGWWKMNENRDNSCSGGTNDVCDSSGNSNDGANTGMTTNNWVSGKLSSALTFDGSDDIVTIPNSSTINFNGASEITVTAWIKPDSLGENNLGRVFDKKESSNGYFAFLNSTDEVAFAVDTLNGDRREEQTTSSPLSTFGTWHHFAATYSSDDIHIYVDGQEQPTSITTAGTGTIVDDGLSLTLGNRASLDRTWSGTIDEIKIYNTALTTAQISYDYNRGLPQLHYKLDECQGGNIYNSTPDGDGTASSSTGTIVIGSSGTNTSLGTCLGTGTTASWANGKTGKFNSGINLDGTDDYAQVASPNLPTGDFTYSAWVNIDAFPTSGATDKVFLANDGITSGANEISMQISETGTVNIMLNDAELITGTLKITTGEWTHLALTRSGSSVKLYLDGIQDPVTASDGTALGFSSCYLMIGADDDSATPCARTTLNDFLDGKVDDLRIYNFPLTATQIKTLYNQSAVHAAPQTGSP